MNGASPPTPPGSGVSSDEPRSSPAASSDGVCIGNARGGGGTAPGGRNVAVAVAPSSSPSVFIGGRAPRIAAGAGAAAGLLALPSTPKLDGASVSRAASRVSAAAVAVTPGGGGMTTAAGSGAVPVPVRAGAAVGAATAGAIGGAAAGDAGAMLVAGLARIGGGGGPIDFGAPVLCGDDGAATGALEALGALAGRGAWRGGGFGDSVKDDSARSGEYATAHAIARLEHYKEISDGGYRVEWPALGPAPGPRYRPAWPHPGLTLAHTLAPWSQS